MKNKYSYYSLDGVPCRILHDAEGREVSGEIYIQEKGFGRFSVVEILFKAIPLSKLDFDNLVIKFTRT